MYATQRTGPGLLLCIGAVLGAGLLSSLLMTFVMLPLGVGISIASGGDWTPSRIIALFALLAGLRAVMAAWIATRIVEACGAFVSFGRALAALLVGSIVGVAALITAILLVAHLGLAGFELLSLSGFIVSVLIMYGAGDAPGGDAVARASAYKVPPSAPPGWPGS
jgi:hypothetical protein